MRRYPEISWTQKIYFKCRIPDSKAIFQIPFGISNNLYKISAGVGPLGSTGTNPSNEIIHLRFQMF